MQKEVGRQQLAYVTALFWLFLQSHRNPCSNVILGPASALANWNHIASCSKALLSLLLQENSWYN